MAATLGGITVTSLAWATAGVLELTFASSHERVHQVYAGRRLAGATDGPDDRIVFVDLDEQPRPVWLSVVAVDDPTVDHGRELPMRPYNTPIVRVPKSPAVDRVEATVGGVTESVVGVQRERAIELPPQPTGPVLVEVVGYDARPPRGNPGPTTTVTPRSRSMPPDVSAGLERFEIASDPGGLRITTTMPSEL